MKVSFIYKAIPFSDKNPYNKHLLFWDKSF